MGQNTQRVGILAAGAPAPVGPYSQAIRAGDFLFTSGLIAFDLKTGALVAGDVRDQARQCFSNVEQILKAGGAEISDVVQLNVYLADLSEWPAMNDICKEAFKTEPYPARTTVFPSILPPGARILIDVVAYKPQ